MSELLRRITAGGSNARGVALPEPTYDGVFEFVRDQAKQYIADPANAPSIEPGDELVRCDRVGRADISYFVAVLERELQLRIPNFEYREVFTFDDLARLLTKHLTRKSQRNHSN